MRIPRERDVERLWAVPRIPRIKIVSPRFQCQPFAHFFQWQSRFMRVLFRGIQKDRKCSIKPSVIGNSSLISLAGDTQNLLVQSLKAGIPLDYNKLPVVSAATFFLIRLGAIVGHCCVTNRVRRPGNLDTYSSLAAHASFPKGRSYEILFFNHHRIIRTINIPPCRFL